MSKKQDRVPARTPTDLERKYNFGKSFAEVYGLATDAQKAADQAEDAAARAEEAVSDLDHEAIFNLFTDNGAIQGIFKGEDGQVYINAAYLAAGIIASADGSVRLDLLNNCVEIDTFNNAGYPGKIQLSSHGIKGFGWDTEAQDYVQTMSIMIGDNMGDASTATAFTSGQAGGGISIAPGKSGAPAFFGTPQSDTQIRGATIKIGNRTCTWKDNGDGTATLIGK